MTPESTPECEVAGARRAGVALPEHPWNPTHHESVAKDHGNDPSSVFDNFQAIT